MAFRYTTHVAMVLVLMAAIPIPSFARDGKNYGRSVFNTYRSLPQNKAACRKTAALVKEKFGGWSAITDKLNGYFTDVYGQPVEVPGNTNIARAQNCMAQILPAFGVLPAQWKMVSNAGARKADYVYYSGVIDGHPVVFSRLGFRFTKDGKLARIQMKNYGTPAGGRQVPAITPAAAEKAATQDLAGVNVTSVQIDEKWAWFPVPRAGGYDLHPSWHFIVSGNAPGSIPLTLDGYIDGLTGEILYRTNQVKETGYDITVKGTVFTSGTSLPATLEALPDIQLNIGSAIYYTDTAGHYSSGSIPLPQSTSIPLKGKWSTVIDYTSLLTPSFVDVVTAPGTTYTFGTSAPCSDRHINAYYHVNRVHNFMKGLFPSFTGMDFSLATNVDVTTGTCNAYYTGRDINFFAAGSGCNSFAEIGDIIYHEYGHGISDHMYREISGGTINNSALNEACSDIWAMSITHDPVLGRNSFTGVGGFIRRYDITPQVYPIDLDLSTYPDPHKNGQIIAGAWWDVGVNIGSVDTMARLFSDVYYDVPDGPDGMEGAVYQTVLLDVLQADDNNADLSDGTPHYSQIVAAFAKHGICLEGDVSLVHDELPDQPSNRPIAITAYLDLGTTDHFHDLTLNYRVNGSGVWNPILLTAVGPAFTGTIPAEPLGTVIEYYFVIHDSLNIANAYFPITCSPALLSNETTIPYQFGVGVHPVIFNDFDTASVTAWGIGNNTGDDATGGIWQRIFPHATAAIWPYGDHTTHSGLCLMTGDGTVSNSEVAYGTTTVLTPVFDISGFTNPVVSYYRWFSNESGYWNFKNDPWIVKIRDASGNSWQTVENTYQCDDNWRRRIFRTSNFLPATATQVQLKFFSSDSLLSNWYGNGQGSTVGGLDDFAIMDNGDGPSGIAGVSVPKIQVLPNPANDKVEVNFVPYSAGSIALYDMRGRLISQQPVSQNSRSFSFNTSDLNAGTYNVVIQMDKSIQSKIITVMHP
jgi:hypothetical protein